MVARMRKTNSAARSLHAGEPSVRAPDDGASTSTSRHRVESASLSRGTRVSELQGCSQISLTWSPVSQPSRP
ncbi:hypothetical protein AXF42_Ash021743 [Apostasia shenzhenica]|uniref:Uncharacterized protein n=1 Tax=Apostasia shenzhenica TaxID=1088818 RepID=A0A2H9ZY62_9ASPA|nr:hypothetical protein AXF42_Ash021743 [Apostasia shenzhenica]